MTGPPAWRLRFFGGLFEKENATATRLFRSYSFRRDISSMGAELSKAAADRADVARVQAGDVEAFAEIVRRWQTPLINLAYRFCGDRNRAEEMAQEAFLRAYRGLDGFRGDAAFSTWLFALATNVYRSELRRIPQRMVALEEAPEPTDPASMPEAHELRDRDRAVRRAVLGLPPKYREAMLLFYFHEMDVPAAAQSLGLPAGTVKARLYRGRELLRAKLPRLLAMTPEGVM
jgi:RNA polymerase sigma-70 factor (ECF subfamily)